jgi:hypothetical protein
LLHTSGAVAAAGNKNTDSVFCLLLSFIKTFRFHVCVAIGNRFIAVFGGGHSYGGSESIELIDTITGESSVVVYVCALSLVVTCDCELKCIVVVVGHTFIDERV